MHCETCPHQGKGHCWENKQWAVYWSEEGDSATSVQHDLHGVRPEWLEQDAQLLGTFQAECWMDMKKKSNELVKEHLCS
jgi:hypothetical protein